VDCLPSRHFRRLFATVVARSDEAHTLHDATCGLYNPAAPARIESSSQVPIISTSGAEFATVECEDDGQQLLPASSFGTCIVTSLAPVAAAASGVGVAGGVCAARLATHYFSYNSQPTCEPTSDVAAVCGKPIMRFCEQRLASTPSLLVITFQPTKPTRVVLSPLIFLTGVGPEANHDAAAAAAPAAYAYQLVSTVTHSGGHFTSTIADGETLLEVNDDWVKRSKGSLARSMTGYAMAVYESIEMPTDAGTAPSVPARATAPVRVKSVQELLEAHESVLDRGKPLVIVIDDDSSEDEASTGLAPSVTGVGSGGRGTTTGRGHKRKQSAGSSEDHSGDDDAGFKRKKKGGKRKK
jgi:hypothetical protein